MQINRKGRGMSWQRAATTTTSAASASSATYQVQFRQADTPSWFSWLLCLYAAFLGHYLVWRTIIVNLHVWFGPLIYGAELYSMFMTVSSLWILHKVQVPIHRPARLAARHVDVFIPTYNEPLTVLEITVHAAKRVRGVGRVLVLDDGNRAEVAQMARRLRADYFAPEHNLHAKAGNMNNGLAHSTAEFILCLD